jgi:fatty-acyl-CoA synthase/long-chain acyl-CoA synthetase
MSQKQPTLKEIYDTVVERYSDRVAVRFGDETITYGTLEDRSTRLASALRSIGLKEGDRVGLMLSNRPEYATGDMALIRSGLAKVPLNDMLSIDDFRYMLGNADVTGVIVGPNFVDTVRQIEDNIDTLEYVVAIEPETSLPDGWHDFHDLVERGEPELPPTSVDADSLGGIFHTGGTTGMPKGVVHTQGNLGLSAVAHPLELDIRPEEDVLLMTPLPHTAGLVMSGGFEQGATHHITQGFDARRALELIEERNISWTFLVPTMIYRLLGILDDETFDTDPLNTIVYGAAPMSPDRLRRGLEKLGDVFLQIYGQYETPDLITVLPKSDHDPEQPELLESCGLPTIMCDVEVRGDEGAVVDRGETGEIHARAHYSMEEYYEMPEKTSETMDEDGWIATGDIGTYDEEGYLYILDRDADVIVSGGMNVYSTAVEDVVQTYEGVENVVVIGTPHEDWGEAVTAIVQPEGETIDEEGLLEYCDEKLAAYKKPQRVETRDELPTTPYGKIDKKVLREPYWEDIDRDVH